MSGAWREVQWIKRPTLCTVSMLLREKDVRCHGPVVALKTEADDWTYTGWAGCEAHRALLDIGEDES